MPPAAARPARATSWRRCTNHPQSRSESVCRACNVGYCDACAKKVQNAAICPACDGLCLSSTAYQEEHDRARQRARPLWDDLGLIFSYPLRDVAAFVMLALLTWLFGLMRGFGGIAYLFSQGVLMWYCFNAVSKVAIGNTRDIMPEFRDVSDIATAARLGLAALLVSAGPLLVLGLIVGASALPMKGLTGRDDRTPVVHAQEVDPQSQEATAPDAGETPSKAAGRERRRFEDEPTPPSPMLFALVVAFLLWKLFYTPVALTVAALSRSFLSTMNPAIGIDTILKMGSVYWQCLAVYTPVAVGQALVVALLARIPIVGGLVGAFVNAYAYLVIGCVLGLGVFKKAPELGWD
jgi:hypothetical protein